MRKWLRIAAIVGVGLLLAAAGGMAFVWQALEQVPDFYEEALAVTPPLEQESADTAVVAPEEPADEPEQIGGFSELLARATARAHSRQAPTPCPTFDESASQVEPAEIQPLPSPQEPAAADPVIREHADEPAVPDSVAPPGGPAEETHLDKLFTRATALANARDAMAVTSAARQLPVNDPPERPTAALAKPQQRPVVPASRTVAARPAAPRTGPLPRNPGQEQRFNALFAAEDINAWLAADLGKNLAKELHGTMGDVRVAIRQDKALVACRYKRGKLNTVLSLSGDVYLTGNNVIAVRIRSARAGAMPMPLSQIEHRISDAAERSGLKLEWGDVGGDLVALVSVPLPRGAAGRPVRLDTVELGDGEIFLSGSPRLR